MRATIVSSLYLCEGRALAQMTQDGFQLDVRKNFPFFTAVVLVQRWTF